MKMRIKKGDTVIVRSGTDKGKRGKVIRVLPKEFRIVVEGVQMQKRHTRPRQAGKKGSIVEHPALIHMSKAMLICPECSQPTRVGFAHTSEGGMRVCKKCKREFA